MQESDGSPVGGSESDDEDEDAGFVDADDDDDDGEVRHIMSKHLTDCTDHMCVHEGASFFSCR